MSQTYQLGLMPISSNEYCAALLRDALHSLSTGIDFLRTQAAIGPGRKDFLGLNACRKYEQHLDHDLVTCLAKLQPNMNSTRYYWSPGSKPFNKKCPPSSKRSATPSNSSVEQLLSETQRPRRSWPVTARYKPSVPRHLLLSQPSICLCPWPLALACSA